MIEPSVIESDADQDRGERGGKAADNPRPRSRRSSATGVTQPTPPPPGIPAGLADHSSRHGLKVGDGALSDLQFQERHQPNDDHDGAGAASPDDGHDPARPHLAHRAGSRAFYAGAGCGERAVAAH